MLEAPQRTQTLRTTRLESPFFGPLGWLLAALLMVSFLEGCTTHERIHLGSVPQHLVSVGEVYDTTRAMEVDLQKMAVSLHNVRLLFLGERHGDARTHALHLRILRQLVAAGRKVHVALEMLPAQANPTLDAWRLGKLDQAVFLQQAQWKQRWGWAFEHYAALFAFFRREHLPLYGVNVSAKTRRLVRQGRPLPLALAREIGPLSAPIPAHTTQFAQLMKAAGGHHGQIHPHSENFNAFLSVQRLWEQAMGRRVAHLVQTLPPKGIVVALMGAGHVRFGLGANLQAARASNQPQWTLLSMVIPPTVPLEKDRVRIPAGIAQWVQVLPPR